MICGFVVGPCISIVTGAGTSPSLIKVVLDPATPNSNGNVVGNVKFPTYDCRGRDTLFKSFQYGSGHFQLIINFWNTSLPRSGNAGEPSSTPIISLISPSNSRVILPNPSFGLQTRNMCLLNSRISLKSLFKIEPSRSINLGCSKVSIYISPSEYGAVCPNISASTSPIPSSDSIKRGDR